MMSRCRMAHDVLRFSRDERGQILRRNFHAALPRRLCGPGVVRRDDAVVEAEKRMVQIGRLLFHDIERRARDLALLQDGDQRLFIEKSAAARVDEKS